MRWGIELAFKDGFCTGEIVGIPTFQEGKVERLSQRLAEAGIGFEDVLFFTDSRNDLPLAERAGYTVCVNPDAVLESSARKTAGKLQSGSSPAYSDDRAGGCKGRAGNSDCSKLKHCR